MTFEHHIRSVASSIAQKIGLLRKCYKTFADNVAVRKSFFAFILPHFEYCTTIWMSAADCHLKLLDRSLNSIKFILPDFSLDLDHRRLVGSISVFFKILNNSRHPLHSALPASFTPTRLTRYTESLNSRALNFVDTRTNQFSRCFMPSMVRLWNGLPDNIVNSGDLTIFKSRVNKFLP